ncbi:MAG: S-layer homology domain-containing protein [Clostridiales bacterium]|jgi:hypothetical protein|nr:S-layer homology domain-containing protein [Clostridiales bacterium]
MKKSILSLFLAFLLVLSSVTQADYFSDLNGFDWANMAILVYAERGIIQGTGWGEFSPAASIKRGDLCLFMHRLLKATDGHDIKIFNDVPSSAYYWEAVGKTSNMLNLDGYEDDTFRPEQPITRAELAVMISYFGAMLPNFTTDFDGYHVWDNYIDRFGDRNQMAEWNEAEIGLCVFAGLMRGDDWGNFNPSGNVRRAEAVLVLNNIDNLLRDIGEEDWLRQSFTGDTDATTPTPTRSPIVSPTPTNSANPTSTPNDSNLDISGDPYYLNNFDFGTWQDEELDAYRRTYAVDFVEQTLKYIIGSSSTDNIVHSQSPFKSNLLWNLSEFRQLDSNCEVKITACNMVEDVIPINADGLDMLGGGIVEVDYSLYKDDRLVVSTTQSWIVLDDLSWGQMRVYYVMEYSWEQYNTQRKNFLESEKIS